MWVSNGEGFKSIFNCIVGKMGAYCQIFSHFSLIFQARKVKLRYFVFKFIFNCTVGKNVSQLEPIWGQKDSNFRLAFEQIDSCGQEIFSVDLTVCMLQTC